MKIPTWVRHLIRYTVIGVVVVVIATTLVALALHAWGAYRLETARADFDSRWAELADPPIAEQAHDDLNGARWLVVGSYSLSCSLEDFIFYGTLADRPVHTWSDGEMSRAKRILRDQEKPLEILLESGSFGAFQLGNSGLRAKHQEIDFLSIVRGLRLLILHARIAWHEDRPTEYTEALGAVSKAADGLMRTPLVMASTVGSSSVRWVVWAATEVVSDPCTATATLDHLRAGLPAVDPVHANDVTMAHSVAELAREGLDYVEDFHDPSLGWSLPFWISNHFLFEDLFLSRILNRWNRQLEAGQQPAALWPPDPSHEIWGEPAWPPGLALTGTFTPNLFAVRVRAQTAATELQQLRLALDLRATAPDGLVPHACASLGVAPTTALTGEPVVCRLVEERGVIVIEVPGGADALAGHATVGNRAELVLPVELVLGPRSELCR